MAVCEQGQGQGAPARPANSFCTRSGTRFMTSSVHPASRRNTQDFGQ
uniref:Uncharacterized protein n=1 Tax=Anguilla anguilla TaxID=7936 RepID=A0A0E9V0J6_ANGAN